MCCRFLWIVLCVVGYPVDCVMCSRFLWTVLCVVGYPVDCVMCCRLSHGLSFVL